MTTMTGGSALIAALSAHGIDIVFGIPGTHNLAAYAAMPEYGIRHVLPRHEQGAGYAADGFARTSGRVGVVLTTTGPAILNACAAASQAYSDSIPVLFISPGMPLGHPGRGNGLLHEVRNQSGAMEAILGNSVRVTSVAEIPLAVAQCFALMTSGRPRPIHLEIPLDLLDASGDVTLVPQQTAAALVPDDRAVESAAHVLAAADTPIMIIGGGARGASGVVEQIAERLGAPVLASTNGKGIVPEDHPLALGAGAQHPAAVKAVAGADAVLAVGTELAPADWWLGVPDINDRLVRIDVDGSAISTNAVPAHGLVGDAAVALCALMEQLGPAPTPTGAIQRAASIAAAIDAEARIEGAPWVEVIDAIGAVLPRTGIVAADNAMVSYYGAVCNLPVYRPNGFLFPTGGGTLGFGLPAGIGAKLANPDDAVIVLQGDGGSMFTINELAMAAEERIALPVVIVDNGGYGEIRNEMADRDDPVHAVALGRPDFPALARSLGCHGVFAESREHLSRALQQALTADRPTVIHIYENSRAATDMAKEQR